MLYTQTSLSLVYNLERVSKSLHCYFATYQFGIVAWLRLEPKNYSTKLYSLHRRCSFGPVAVALGQFSESFVLSAVFLLLGVVCVALDLLLGVGGRQMSLSLRAGRAALAEDMGMTLICDGGLPKIFFWGCVFGLYWVALVWSVVTSQFVFPSLSDWFDGGEVCRVCSAHIINLFVLWVT